MNDRSKAPKPFTRSPSVEISTWYKGILCTQLASAEETGGDFDFILSNMRKGTEPPPHVHARENEFMYVLTGNLTVYIEDDMFDVAAGGCIFLPKARPHAFVIKSPKIQMLVMITPGGFMNAINQMAMPARRMEIPPDDEPTYSTSNLEDTVGVFDKHGVHFLTPEEMAQHMPRFGNLVESRRQP
jgi:mannose-6-phosphate isomerase-like protein (cupin superfamily)